MWETIGWGVGPLTLLEPLYRAITKQKHTLPRKSEPASF